jgi:hypothetical protein
MTDYWELLQELFDDVCSLDEANRRVILEQRCNGDTRLRSDVERMVRAYQESSAANEEARRKAAGRRFGAWQTARLLARGGMGEVWLARRADGEHEQQAALKILSPYLASPDAVDRFRRERQLLARLEHPNIARLLDGGMSAQGEPYLVMEYVEGVRLDRYCEERGLSVRERLQLFLKVCAAVNAAHQYFVVHRDLKPSNILVTADGEPKLLDFGIAKLIDSEAGLEQTATANIFLTPMYASPEILRGHPATVASDIYSLGLVLYELLAGRRPFDASKLSPVALIEAVTERDVPPPSSVAAAALAPALAGDLDAIALKALAKNPEERYASAAELAEDIRRYLSGQPVLAVRATWTYVARKFIRRNRLAVGLTTLALVGLAAGVSSTVIQKRVAQRRFDEVRRLAHYVLFDLYDDVSNLSASTRVRAEMANRATEYLNTLAKEAKSDRGLRLELAEGYLRLGDIQGNMFRSNLGDTRAALGTYQKGLDLLQPLRNDPGAVRLRTLIEVHRAQATDAHSAGKETFDHLHAAVENFEKLAGNLPSVDDDYQLGQAYSILGELEQQQGGWVRMSGTNGSEFDRAEAFLRRAVELQPSNPDYTYSLAELLDRRAQLSAALTPQRAIDYDQQAVNVLNRVRQPNRGYPAFRLLLGRVHSVLLYAFGQLNQIDAATEQGSLAEQIYLPLAAASPEDHDLRYRLAVLRRLMGVNDAYAKRWNASADDFAKGVADYDILLQSGSNSQYRGYRAELRMRMADDLWEAGRHPEAEAAAKAGLAEFRELTASPDAKFPVLRQAARYTLFTEVKNLRDAKAALELSERARSTSSDPFQLYELLGAAYAENHRYREAVDSMRKAIAALPPAKPGEAPSRARRSSEATLSEYERAAKSAGQ